MDKNLKRDLQHTPKETKITLDKERTFRLDLNAYFELDLLYEDKGKTYHTIEADLIAMRPYAIRAFLWAGMVHEDPNLKIEDIGKFIDIENIKEFASEIYELILDDKTEAKEEEQENTDDVKKK